MLDIDLNNDNMREIFNKVKDKIDSIESNSPQFYESEVLPYVANRVEGAMYLKVKSSNILNCPMGMTLNDGTVRNVDIKYALLLK